MGESIEITSSDGFTLGAYQASPEGEPKGAVVVIQEIFGVNGHIREVVDGYAADGYFAIAPQIFDRVEPGIELGYDEAGMNAGIEIAFQKIDIPVTLQDIQAAINAASAHGKEGKVGVVGYCFGGLLTWLSACELNGVTAVSAYYGGGLVGEAERSAKCPVIMHFGELDAHIPLSDVEKIKAAQPDATGYVYAADHGFNCDHRESYNADASALAKERTLAFFSENLG